MERARACAEAKAKEKADIARVNVKATKRAREESEARVLEKANAVYRVAMEAAANIRVKEEAEGEKREMEEAEARANAEAEIWKKAEKTSKARETKEKGGLSFQSWQGHGKRPKKRRRKSSPGLMTRIGRRTSSRRGK